MVSMRSTESSVLLSKEVEQDLSGPSDMASNASIASLELNRE